MAYVSVILFSVDGEQLTSFICKVYAKNNWKLTYIFLVGAERSRTQTSNVNNFSNIEANAT